MLGLHASLQNIAVEDCNAIPGRPDRALEQRSAGAGIQIS